MRDNVAKECRRGANGMIQVKCVEVSLTKEQLQEYFTRFDKDHDSVLSKQEIGDVFKMLGSHFPTWRAGRAIAYADQDGNGKISEAEFDDLVKYALQRNFKIA